MSSASLPSPDRERGCAFVTGGTGFVGSHLVEELLARGYREVRCLVRKELKWLEGLPVKAVSGDLSDADAVRAGVDGADVVFHVAGLTRARSWEAFRAANVDGTLRLLDAAARASVARVLVTSSLAAVGRASTPVADETTPLNPISLYGRSKAEMEEAMVPWMDRVPCVVVRPPAVYGPRDSDIFTVFQAASRGLFPIVGSASGAALTLVHVGDLVCGMVDAAEYEAADGRTYFVGAEPPHAWGTVRDAAAAALGRRVLTVPVPRALVVPVGSAVQAIGRLFGTYPPLNREKALEIRHACTMCRSDRAEADFGYRARIPLEQGFAGTVAWYRANGWLR